VAGQHARRLRLRVGTRARTNPLAFFGSNAHISAQCDQTPPKQESSLYDSEFEFARPCGRSLRIKACQVFRRVQFQTTRPQSGRMGAGFAFLIRHLTGQASALLAEFGTGDIELEKISLKYFGLSAAEARRRASLNKLPVAAFRTGSQKAPWMVSAADLAKLIDDSRANAEREWQKSQLPSFSKLSSQ